MKNEGLIIEAAALVHEDWCKQELESFFSRAKAIYDKGTEKLSDALYGACYKNGTKRNEIYIDVPFIMGHEIMFNHCLDDFEYFMRMIKLGAIDVKRFVPRNLTEEEIKEKSSKGDYKKDTKEENILCDFIYLSTDSQKENLDAAISAYTIFEQLSKLGITVNEMTENPGIRNLIGIGIHADWMKRNPNHPNKKLMVPYSELDEWTKKQDLVVFDALLKVVKANNVVIKKETVHNYVGLPDYLLEEAEALETMEKEQDNKISEKQSDESQITGLYVACKIADDVEVLEPFEQYVSFGRNLHKLVVFPHRVLLYTKLDENGKLFYYDALTNEKVNVLDPSKPLHSYETHGSVSSNLIGMVKQGFSTGIPSMNRQLIKELRSMYNQYGLVVPFEKFYEQKFGKKLQNISIPKALMILGLTNLFINKPIILSTDKNVALQQLERIGYVSKENVSRKK